MSAFLLRFKANHLDKMRDYSDFSSWIPINPRKDLLFPHGPNQAQKPLYLIGTVLNATINWVVKQCVNRLNIGNA